MSQSAGRGPKPLAGTRICLIFEHSLSHYTRLRLEIDALIDAGAAVELVTSHRDVEGAELPIESTWSPLLPSGMIGESHAQLRPIRVGANVLRNILRPLLWGHGVRKLARTRVRDLTDVARRCDLFWVIDYPSLATAVQVAGATGTKLVYETMDLVPEFEYHGASHRRRSLREEARLIGAVDGFITVCDSYADYYMERYGGRQIMRRPLVRNDMPDTIVEAPKPTSRPLRILFLGSLMADRPVEELIRAIAAAPGDLDLTIQGKNYLGDAPGRLIADLGLENRVRILPPCPYDQIVQTAADYDLGVVALRGADENERRAETTKLYTYMSAGLAVIASDLPGIARVVNRSRNGILVDGMSPEVWTAAFTQASTLDVEEIDSMRARSVETARAHALDLQRPLYIDEFVRALAGVDPAQVLAEEVLAQEGSAGRKVKLYERTLGLAVAPVLVRRALIQYRRRSRQIRTTGHAATENGAQ